MPALCALRFRTNEKVVEETDAPAHCFPILNSSLSDSIYAPAIERDFRVLAAILYLDFEAFGANWTFQDPRLFSTIILAEHHCRLLVRRRWIAFALFIETVPTSTNESVGTRC
jgi:hypothetical protein